MDEKVKEAIDKSVLCWLATATPEGVPNVSPKEVFTYFNDTIIIANIASPNSVKNIRENDQVCVSFIDILVQKGFQVKGKANILDNSSEGYSSLEKPLLAITQGKYPFQSITQIEIQSIKPIIAPSYFLFPERTEQDQIESAMKTYGFTTWLAIQKWDGF